ncbi:MAG: histidine phosphatase family protein [Candidatus Hydrogenedentes bacterium]|nr:histidine phosphatase family protein [Candidatus Hydrogenedentota bacterium]
MSILHVVRHGQASFFSEDYDRLSELGRRQSRLLGEYWVRQGYHFDRAIAGPKKRHRDTALETARAFADARIPFPELETMAGFDEFQADQLVAHSVSELSTQYEHVRRLHETYAAAEEQGERKRSFQKFMEAVTVLWARADFESPALEPWAGFSARVYAAIDQIIAASASGSRVAVFTSGGPASVAVQRALDMAPDKTLELIWTLRNAAEVEFLYTGNRFTLSTFNSAPHLPTQDLWTFR